MYQTLLIIQCVNVIALLFESVYICKNWKTRTHGYLFFYCLATLINNLGYLAVMLAHTRGEALFALQASYFGRVWIPLAFLLFGLKLCKKKLTKKVVIVLTLFHLLTYIAVLTTEHHPLYYTTIGFTEDGLYPHLICSYGIWRNTFMTLMLLYALYFFIILIRCIIAEKNHILKKRFLFVLAASMVQILFFVLEISGLVKGYDLTMLGYSAGTFFMYIALFRYDLLDIKDLAKEFVMDHLSEAIVAVTADGQVSFFNETASKLFPQLLTDPTQAVATVQALAKQQQVLYIDNRIFQPNKNELYRGQKLLGTAYVFEDATERLMYIRELEAQKRIADDANDAKSSFLARMSHEIRTPISAILGFDELILRECDNDTILNYAHDIQTSGMSLLSIINDILDFSKIEAGKMQIIPMEYDVGNVITDLVNMVSSRAEKKGLTFITNVDSNIPRRLIGDEVRIKQCALNMLTNAIKYTPSGTVTFSIGCEPLDANRIYLTVSVQDTGIGIKSEDIDRLFSPFERLEEKRNRTIEGTGLGMSIVKNLLAAMGSRLEVTSEYGKGSAFSFRIKQPIASQEKVGSFDHIKHVAAQKAGTYHAIFQAPEAKILVVDDTPINLAVIRGLLKKTLVQIDTASDGEMGLEKAHAEHYDLMLIDHLMPKMDGMEMITALRKETYGLNASTPCIVLTANAISGARDTYLAAGFTDYLSKPVTGATLEKALRTYLPANKIRT